MKRKERGLSALLAKSFLLFALTLAVAAGGVYWLWSACIDRIYSITDWDQLLADSRLEQGDYDALRAYLGSSDSFAVLTPDGDLLWSSDESLGALTQGELACVSDYSSGSHVEAYPIQDGDSEARYRVTRYTEDGGSEEMELDGDLRVVSGGLGDGRERYTRREYAILAGLWPARASLSRFSFTGADGESRVLLMSTAFPDEQTTYAAYQASWRVWLLLLPVSVLAGAFFAGRIRRAIRLPLDRLHDAMLAQVEGRSVRVGNCTDVRELKRIGETFDMLSDRLAESERERERLDRDRQRMIADISHDIKTPVTVIAGYADALAAGKNPARGSAALSGSHPEPHAGAHRAGQRFPRIRKGGASGVHAARRAHRSVRVFARLSGREIRGDRSGGLHAGGVDPRNAAVLRARPVPVHPRAR